MFLEGKEPRETPTSVFENPPGTPQAWEETVPSEAEMLFHRQGFCWEVTASKEAFISQIICLDFQPKDNREKIKNSPRNISVNPWPWTR